MNGFFDGVDGDATAAAPPAPPPPFTAPILESSLEPAAAFEREEAPGGAVCASGAIDLLGERRDLPPRLFEGDLGAVLAVL